MASITILPNPCIPSATVNVHGIGFLVSQKVKLNLSGGVIKIRADGTFDVPMVAPAKPGNYTLTIISQPSGAIMASATLNVVLTAPPPPPPPPPTPTVSTAPTGLTATPSDSTVDLSWTAPSSDGGSAIAGYKVYRNTFFLTQLGVVTTFRNLGLSNGTPYTYTVSALNSVGESALSNSATATPNAAIPPSDPIPVISAITLTNLTGTSVRFNWHVSEPAQGWVEYGPTLSYGSETAHELSFNYQDHTQPTSGLTASTLYNYRIHAVDTSGNHVISPNGTFSTPAGAATAPTVPLSLTGTVGNTQVTLNWLAPTSNGGSVITSYRIYRNGVLLVTTGNVLTYTNTNLLNGSTFTYAISAINAIGEGPKTANISVTLIYPPAPSNFTATAGNQSVTLNWGA